MKIVRGVYPVTLPYYPCDRGIVGNVQSRGWHKFVVSMGVTICEYCGVKA